MADHHTDDDHALRAAFDAACRSAHARAAAPAGHVCGERWSREAAEHCTSCVRSGH